MWEHNRMTMQDEEFIRVANDLAKQARIAGEHPFGAVLVYQNKIVHKAHDRCIELCDPTAHAELHVIREYCQLANKMSLQDYVLYCSTEPCVMCSGAIHWAHISRVVFSVSQQMLQHKSSGTLKPSAKSLINIGKRVTEVVGPVLPDEGLAIFEGYTFTSKADEFEKRRRDHSE